MRGQAAFLCGVFPATEGTSGGGRLLAGPPRRAVPPPGKTWIPNRKAAWALQLWHLVSLSPYEETHPDGSSSFPHQPWVLASPASAP